jgi:hypothetical protein
MTTENETPEDALFAAFADAVNADSELFHSVLRRAFSEMLVRLGYSPTDIASAPDKQVILHEVMAALNRIYRKQ